MAEPRLVALGDAHLLGADDPEQRALCELLEGLDAALLVLLGDVLHAGWTWGGLPHPDHAPVFAALEALTRRGVRLVWIPGNHDLGVRPRFPVELRPSLRLRWGSRTLLFVHGDEADRSPGYRALSAALRGRPFAALMDGLGPARGMALLRRIAGPRHEEARPPEALVAAQRAWATRALEDPDLDLVVMGHSHALGVVDLPGGRLVHAGAWLGHRSYLELSGGEPVLRTPEGRTS